MAPGADGAGSALVIGEALVDIVDDGSGSLVEAPGGSPLNVAVTMSRLGVATRLLSALGDDKRADQVAEHLAASGVQLLPGARRLPRTSTATARTDASGAASYDFDVSWDPPAAETSGHGIVHAGSLGLFLQPGEAVVHRALAAGAAGGAVVSLDPNVRPGLLGDHATALGRFEELLALAHVVKLSDEDAAWFYPGTDPRDVARRILDRGPALVTVTRGADGCLMTTRETTCALPSAATPVVDTIGAGDAFMGAMLRELLVRGLLPTLVDRGAPAAADLEAVGVAAARVAALTVGRRGADPPWRDEVDAARR